MQPSPQKNARRAVCWNISRWKRGAVRAMLTTPAGPPVFCRTGDGAVNLAARIQGEVVVWASKNHDSMKEFAQMRGVPVALLEDGFIRSVGLGAAFVGPASLVLDRSGIYYDPAQPSDLEDLLENEEFPPALLTRAQKLREELIRLSVTKYNLITDGGDIVVPPGQRVILVPGQVEDDASIRKGSPFVRTNLALLEAARARHPDAFIIYKPHPDVAAGYRQGAIPFKEAVRLADAVAERQSITDLFRIAHHVETMTSLAGFEALLRGLRVTCHGQPFYAGWGLTEDLHPIPRRTRKRNLDELVAAALILYPRYADPVTGRPCTAEDVVKRLAEEAAKPPSPKSEKYKKMRHLYALLRHRLFGLWDARKRR